MRNSSTYAVLSGDVVKSTALGENGLEALRDCWLEATREVRAWRRGLVRSKPEFFRGDAWQLVLEDPGMALRVAIFLRATLRARMRADSRVAIGLGTVRKISRTRTSLSSGEAFEVSGRALDGMDSRERMTIEAARPGGDWLPVVGVLCDELITRWSWRQAEFVARALHPSAPTHEEIAKAQRPAVTKQTVTKALNAAGWHAIEVAVERFESLWGQDSRKRLSGVRQPKTAVRG